MAMRSRSTARLLWRGPAGDDGLRARGQRGATRPRRDVEAGRERSRRRLRRSRPTRGWAPAYGAAGVTLTIGAPSSAGGDDSRVARPLRRCDPSLPVVGGRTRCDPGSWRGAHSLGYQWFRGGRPIAKATAARYRVAPADGGHTLSCPRDGPGGGRRWATATSRRARALLGLSVSGVSLAAGGVSASCVCARERAPLQRLAARARRRTRSRPGAFQPARTRRRGPARPRPGWRSGSRRSGRGGACRLSQPRGRRAPRAAPAHAQTFLGPVSAGRGARRRRASSGTRSTLVRSS